MNKKAEQLERRRIRTRKMYRTDQDGYRTKQLKLKNNLYRFNESHRERHKKACRERYYRKQETFVMIHPDMKSLKTEIDKVIAKFISLNINIADTKNEHKLMVFMLEREGNKFFAKSCTRAIRHCKVDIDDTFSVDELLQELHTKCQESINNSKRYTVA
jgi:hypothetical protein